MQPVERLSSPSSFEPVTRCVEQLDSEQGLADVISSLTVIIPRCVPTDLKRQ